MAAKWLVSASVLKGMGFGISEEEKERGEGEGEREKSQLRRAGHNKRLVEQVHLLRQIANLRLMHFRRARTSPAGYLYAPCSRSSDPLPSTLSLL